MDEATLKRREQLARIPAMDCGLYRTTLPMPGHDDHLGPDQLVMLHDHRPDALPFVLFAAENDHNRWHFLPDGHNADDADFLMGLLPLPPEGLYVLRRAIALSDDEDDKLSERSLVMVGYNRQGHLLLFPPRYRPLHIHFPDQGYRFEDPDMLDALEPVNFETPEDQEDRLLH